MLKHSQHQKLSQRLSPMHIQLMQLLQVATVDLEERVKAEIEENPALEQGSDTPENDTYDQEDADFEDATGDEAAETPDIDDFLQNDNLDDEPYTSTHAEEGSGGTGMQEGLLMSETTLYDHLNDQIGMLDMADEDRMIAEQIIGSIDDDGYLRREPSAMVDDLAFAKNVFTTEEKIAELIARIQQLDPPGIGARTLQECLQLQLERLPQHYPAVTDALKIIKKFFNEFISKNYEKIQKGIELDGDNTRFRNAVNVIRKLSPKPGAAYSSQSAAETYIVPDFFIFNNNGSLELSLNNLNAPELRVSEDYRELIKTYQTGDKKKDKRQREAVQFIKQKVDSAKWFIDALKQRQHSMLSTMQAIMSIQKEFFLSGDEATLKPMVLRDVAQIGGFDISTISRVANSKYVQTEFGTFKLKYFFSEAVHTDSGEDTSSRVVKMALQEFIAGEDKQAPLSDDRLAELLNQKGFNMARRTVAKYREGMNIPVARLRREL